MTGTDTSKIDEQTWRAGAGPEWFRISRYEKTHFLNAAQWATLLEYRREAWLYLQTDRPFESDDDPITSECLAGFYKFMAPIWDDPLLVGSRIDSAPNRVLSGYLLASDPEMANLASQLFGRFVKRADVGELVSALAVLGPVSESLLSAWLSGRAADFYPEDPVKERSIWNRELSPRSGRVLLSINLEADHRDAVKQFKALFKELQPQKPTQRPNITAFVHHRLLAYLDLLLWTLAIGHLAPWEEMLIVVFGSDSGDREVDAFRKFATKHATETFKGTLIQRLRGMAKEG